MEEMKDTIYHTFSRLLSERGLKNVTMDILAETCGISKKTIYKYYNGKDELVKIYINAMIHRIKYDILTIKEDISDPHEKIIAFYEKIFTIMRNAPGSIIEESIKYYPETGSIIAELKSEYSRFILNTIQEGIDKGIFKSLNPLFVERFYLGAVNSVFSETFLENHDIPMDEVIESFRSVLSTGILKTDECP